MPLRSVWDEGRALVKGGTSPYPLPSTNKFNKPKKDHEHGIEGAPEVNRRCIGVARAVQRRYIEPGRLWGEAGIAQGALEPNKEHGYYFFLGTIQHSRTKKRQLVESRVN